VCFEHGAHVFDFVGCDHDHQADAHVPCLEQVCGREIRDN
jgi:hypothetical protein